MARADAPRERIGEMLLSLGLITRGQLDEALKAQIASGMPIGKQLVALGSVSETRLTQVLSNQLSVPWVSLERVEFSAELLARVPGELADRRSALPIYVRAVRGKGATLYVAMDDPTDEAALEELTRATNMPVRPMIAPPSEIRRAIEHRYFGAPTRKTGFSEPATGLRSVPKDPAPAASANGSHKAKPPPPRKPPPPPGKKSPPTEALVPIEQYETPSQPPAGQAQRMLTLLDGTQIKLPTAKAPREASDVRTVRHVVKAIRAARAQLPSEDSPRWHDIVQALLDAAEARGVRLTRRELAEAWLAQRVGKEGTKLP